MPHETTLIATIVVALVVAFVLGFLAQRIRISPLVGYLLAGIIIGPFTPGFVADSNLAAQLAEIGVILLMFGVGLHFSVKDLMAVRRIAIPGAVGQILVATAFGAGMAHFWGWSWGAGIVFGLALSVASTVVLLRALEERKQLASLDGRIAVGWLIVEDLAMVLALVLLPALAELLRPDGASTTQAVSTLELAKTIGITIGKVVLFIVLALVVGRKAVPFLLARVARTGSRELFTLAVLAIALGIAYGSALLFDVSLALGAFFAGVILAESDLSYQAAADSLPFRDAFAVLFFVSVGMLFNPAIVVEKPLLLLGTVATIIVGKSLAAFAIVIALRFPASTALIVSASLAQIGEFSFILASLGVTLALLPPEGRDLILAGALISIALNPAVFWCLERFEPNLSRFRWARPGAARLAGDKKARLDLEDLGMRDHAVLIGYGRVGALVGQALHRVGLPFVVVELDWKLVERLRKERMPVIFGDAAAPEVLEAAGVDRARLLIVALPDGFRAGQIVARARAMNPTIDTLARAHSDDETAFLERQGVGLALMGERELAFGMLRYSLRSLGLPADRTEAIVDGYRNADPPPNE
ncbi:MAG: YbaL family putative K(+) efflux transporter [Alphaproteobacteria bacterium]